jgi:glycopeptide antibiotics resistance protein
VAYAGAVKAFRTMELSDDWRRGLMAVLVVYSAVLAVALLAPTSGTQSGMASWVSDLGVWVGFSPAMASQARAEFLCNVAILAPVSALGSLIWPRTTWRDWTAYAFVIAVLVELTQGMVLSARTASDVDIVANTLGGLGGALVVLVWRRLTP